MPVDIKNLSCRLSIVYATVLQIYSQMLLDEYEALPILRAELMKFTVDIAKLMSFDSDPNVIKNLAIYFKSMLEMYLKDDFYDEMWESTLKTEPNIKTTKADYLRPMQNAMKRLYNTVDNYMVKF